MTYDVETGPPRSVRVQRAIEGYWAQVRAEVTPRRVLAVLAVALVVDAALSGDVSAADGEPAPAEAAAWLAGWTLADVGWLLAGWLAVSVAAHVVVALHEGCHVAAFEALGYSAGWRYDWTTFRGRNLYVLPPGGVAYTRYRGTLGRLTWAENALVCMAPLVLAAAGWAVLGAYHWLVAPVPSGELLFLAVIWGATAGPSIPDYADLLPLPRGRWEAVQASERALGRHCAAEGIER